MANLAPAHTLTAALDLALWTSSKNRNALPVHLLSENGVLCVDCLGDAAQRLHVATDVPYDGPAVTLHTRALVQHLKRANKTGGVSITGGAGKLVVEDAMGRAEYLTAKAIEHGPSPAVEGPSAVMDRRALLDAMSRIAPSMGKDANRYGLHGAAMETWKEGAPGKAGDLVLAATDGSRLAVTYVEAHGDLPDWTLNLWNRPGFDAALRLLRAATDDAVRVTWSQDRLHLSCGPWSLTTSFGREEFVNWRHVVPTGAAAWTLSGDRKALLSMFREATHWALDRYHTLRIDMHYVPTAHTQNVDVGAWTGHLRGATAKLDPDWRDKLAGLNGPAGGDFPRVGVNASYMVTALQQHPESVATLSQSEHLGPLVLSSERLLQLVMPKRLD